MYLAWFDADRKKPVALKIAEAHERYVAKFGRQPLVCLVNPEDATAEAGIALRPLHSIGRNCFWIGTDDDTEAEAELPTEVVAPATRAKRPRRSRERETAPAMPAVPARVAETIAPTASLSEVIAPPEPPAARPRRTRKVAIEQRPEVAPPAPVEVSPKRRARRERPAA